ncbi:unnamed protein product [Lactuca virosa]|uniref:Replication protein A 70 kDa DNA-binding subunit B/D first OB fold domain-containing protein n=1 Tax=Lactuca virosa TaxID=75947 RepID=A0AAU9P5N0_9ASTR|nr:unnamed protein product [Lactuca virosa]
MRVYLPVSLRIDQTLFISVLLLYPGYIFIDFLVLDCIINQFFFNFQGTMEDITPVKEIDSIKDNFTIKVRIIRLWTQKSKFDANDTYSIEMILMDEEGRKIHASCLKKWFPKFQRYLKEDASLYIRKPNVAPNTSNFNFADPDRKLTLNPDTTLKECENFSGSAHGFAFVDFHTILSNNILESNSIGWDTKLKVTLWGHNAYYMHDFLANNNNLAPIVVIVQFVKVKFINGRPFTSTYFDVSRLFINNDIDEITIYKNNGIKMIASKQDTEHDNFLKNNLFSNIDDVFEPLKGKTVVIVGTVKGIRQNIRWYYLACSNCKKSAKRKESSTDKVDGSHAVVEIVTYECANHKCKNIKFSVSKLGINLDLYPMELKVVVDKKLAIKFDISRYNVTNKSDNLTPCARDNSTATSPTKLISTPTELKRNLATCIDLDEMENLSTSKSARLPPPGEQPMPLLVPKKEK